MKYGLKTKLSLSYVLVSLISVILIIILINFLFERQFGEYIKKNQDMQNKKIVERLGQLYLGDGKWDEESIEDIGVNALESGLIIKIRDISGNVIWDATVHNNGMCQRIIEQMAQNMNSKYPFLNGGYKEEPFNVVRGLNKVGYVDIGYYGPFYLTENDLAFINTLNKFIIGAGIFSLMLALVIGNVMAKRLSKPITRVTNTAEMISKGHLEERIDFSSNTREIIQLTASVNNLADTLEKQEKLRKRLTADVAHELRTPLSTLQSHMEAMIDGIWEADSERLKSCHEEILRISKLVGDLERLAKFEGENLILDKTKFDLNEQIGRIIRNFQSDFINKGVDLSYNGDKENIFADKDKISQVVVNLLSNALKYTPEGGRVEVTIKGNQDITEICIKDTGSGIQVEDLPYIFERFYRADKSRNRLTGGFGIGLTIAKAIVEAHNGKIKVRSEVDKGTEFVVSLPKQME
ncbi:MAG: sensor histidine kinase [Bacillota bacterium]